MRDALLGMKLERASEKERERERERERALRKGPLVRCNKLQDRFSRVPECQGVIEPEIERPNEAMR